MKPVICFFLLGVMFVAVSCKTDQQQTQKPNIIWILAEDMGADFGVYGTEIVNTPNIDTFASKGVVFDNAFATSPVCSPSRSSLITGMYATSIGGHQHRSSRRSVKIHLPDSVKTIPEIFRENGYAAINAGIDFHAKTDFNFEYDENEMYTDVISNPRDKQQWDPFWSEAGNKPFFLQVQLQGGKAKHGPDRVDARDVDLPPYYPEDSLFREYFATYYESVVYMDEIIGDVVSYLKENNVFDNSAIFLFTDHGMGMLRHKQWNYDGGIHIPLIVKFPHQNNYLSTQRVNKLVSMIDISATSLDLAGIPVPDWMQGKSFIKEGFNRPYVFSTRDRCDWTRDRIRSVRSRDYKYIRNFHPAKAYSQSSYRETWPEWKHWEGRCQSGNLDSPQTWFCAESRPPEEFYDLINDPHEVNNLAGNPRYQDELESYRKVLNDWVQRTRDQGEIPESEESLQAAREFRHGQGWNPENK